MITVGPMQLNQPEALDPMEAFFLGTQANGGYWQDVSRLSSHDHSGGLLGAPVAVSIPDGSITAADLDPSVLAPYALVDGSKPFTGQVTMQADAVVRDALYFGQQGTALAPDVTLSRTGVGALRVDTTLGVGVNPSASIGAGLPHLQIGGTAGMVLTDTGQGGQLLYNSVQSGASTWAALVTGGALRMRAISGSWNWDTAPSVAAGAAQTFTTRASIAPTGTLTLTPDAGQPSLLVGTARIQGGATLNLLGTDTVYLRAQDTSDQWTAQVNRFWGFGPGLDNQLMCGHPTVKWTQVSAVAGTINTSSAALKEAITPLDPSECYQAAKDVVWYDFRYLPPTYYAPEPPPEIAYDAADDNETKAEKKAKRDEAEAQARAAHLKMVAETAPARHQRGFVYPTGDAKDEAGGTLPPVPELFGLSDRESTTPQADLATLGCAMQALIAKVEALEAKVS